MTLAAKIYVDLISRLQTIELDDVEALDWYAKRAIAAAKVFFDSEVAQREAEERELRAVAKRHREAGASERMLVIGVNDVVRGLK